jgi:DNA-binding transcriptional ArsR family regulator
MINREQIENISNGLKQVLGEDDTERVKVSVFVGKYKPKGIPEFTMFFQGVNAALTKGLAPGSCKILLWLMSIIEYGNYIEMHVETIMQELDLSRATVSRAIKELKDKNIIISEKSSIDKRLNMYSMNPHHSWKGHLNDRVKAIKAKGSIINQLPMFDGYDAISPPIQKVMP